MLRTSRSVPVPPCHDARCPPRASRFPLLVVSLLALVLSACSPESASETSSRSGAAADELAVVRIGIVAKSQSNPVFQAAHAGALAAAEQFGAEYGVHVNVDILTPADEDPAAQAAAIEQLARAGFAGIAVSCSDANTVTPAIDKAVELGAQVVCFDSDAPRSKRFAFFGTDDQSCGEAVMRELAAAMGETGTVAILAGNQAAPNLQARVVGVKAELARHPGMALLADGVFYHPETPERAAEAVASAQSTHPEIGGWAMVGGWPLFTRGALHWEPGAVQVVSVDDLPAQLAYLESGHVGVLLAQDCYGWGRESVRLLLDKIVRGQDPPGGVRQIDPLQPVHAADVPRVRAEWERWLGGH